MFIEVLKTQLDIKAWKNKLPTQQGDVPITYANVDDLMKDVGFKPSKPLKEGLRKFVEKSHRFFHLQSSIKMKASWDFLRLKLFGCGINLHGHYNSDGKRDVKHYENRNF